MTCGNCGHKKDKHNVMYNGVMRRYNQTGATKPARKDGAKEDSKGWLDIPELGISVELEVHDKGKSWDKLDLKEKEDELLTLDQCVWLANSKYAKPLKMDGSSTNDDFFIQQPFELNRRNGYVARFCACSDWVVLGAGFGSVGSDSALGVRYKREIKKLVG